MAILLISLVAGIAGFAWLKLFNRPAVVDIDPDAMDYETTEAKT